MTVDVVVPACNEEALLPACLGSVIAQRGAGRVHLIVVANGCSDRTVDVAEECRDATQAAGHRLTIVELPRGGKSAALNAADDLLSGRIHVYLDADVVLTSGALRGLVVALPESRPGMASPSPAPLLPTRRLARRYARVWAALPSVAGEVTGNGCYAVSRAGRGRWRSLPEIVADDAFVRARFAPGERSLVRDQHFVFAFPDDPSLLGVLARWRCGNRELAQHCDRDDPRTPLWRSLLALTAQPSLWADLPAFLAVSAAVRLRPARGVAWARAPRPLSRPSRPMVGRPSMTAVIVTHNSADEIAPCVEQLESALASTPHRLVVVDNASTDDTADIASRCHATVTVHRNADNIGFGAAVNRAARDCDSDFLLLVNPDAGVDAGTIEMLIAVARRFPEAGIYGGQAILPNGQDDPFSRLAGPTLRRALGFAVGIPAFRWRWAQRPRRPRTRSVDHVAPAPALCGALLLIDTKAWRRLEGFDERFVMYGEDVDLCWRARAAGYEPLHVRGARYTHVGAIGFSALGRHRLLLTAECSLYRRHTRGWRRRAALAALVTGTAARAAAGALLASPNHRTWSALWSERESWRGGWERAPSTALAASADSDSPQRRRASRPADRIATGAPGRWRRAGRPADRIGTGKPER